jgi:hypothetical protein
MAQWRWVKALGSACVVIAVIGFFGVAGPILVGVLAVSAWAEILQLTQDGRWLLWLIAGLVMIGLSSYLDQE